MKRLAIAAVAVGLFAPAANAATDLTSVMVTGPSGTVWNTQVDSFYAVFLQRPIGNILNPEDNFSGSATTEGANNYLIAGDGFPAGVSENSDAVYTLTLMFADGATISGQYVNSDFVGGTSSTVGDSTYTLTGFGWDRSPADNVSEFRAVSGGDPADYVGQFAYSAVTAAVPEPAAWTLLVLSFGAIGGAMRARTRRSYSSRRTLTFS